MKKVIVIILVILVSVGVVYIASKRIFNTDRVKDFKELVKYQTNSVNDDKKVSKILQNLELDNYSVKVEKATNNTGETITIYYDCTDEEKVTEYYRNFHNYLLLEKNATILFALINNLNEVKYIFEISNIELANSHHLDTQPKEYIYTRENIERCYNRNVREYVDNPNDFMKYNIDLNIKNATIYYTDYYSENIEIKKLELNQEEINKIIEFIKKDNFSVAANGGIDGMTRIWLDLNNGYIIGIYDGETELGEIIKGNGKDIFEGEKIAKYNSVLKTLPKGLPEYVKQIINNK